MSTPPWTSPDDTFTSHCHRHWSSPLKPSDMSDSSTPPDFAFEPPSMSKSNSAVTFDGMTTLKTPTYPGSATGFNGGFAQPYPPNYSFSSASSFSSTGGSATGTSFSSTDALPAISRDFVRPSSSETRRPATAAGAMQSFGFEKERVETIDETAEAMFTNPFEMEDKEKTVQQDTLDPHFIPPNRRASAPQYNSLNVQPWSNTLQSEQQQTTTLPMTSAPPNVTQFTGGLFGASVHTQLQQLSRQTYQLPYSSRPQTSDGLPSYGHVNPNGISLPSAKTLVNQIDPNPAYYNQGNYMPFRNDNRSASVSHRHYSDSDKRDDDADLTFVPLGGPAPKKRPRRRYDEIERLYLCGWNGCEKSYGTLNHLNAHVAMQKHGEKRLPTEFKEMRKTWRKKKREQAAVAANAQYSATSTTWNPRHSVGSSESDYDRRDSTVSMFSSGSDYASRGSVVYSQGWADSSRPSTSSSVASSADGRFAPVGGAYAHGMINPAPAVRRPSAPNHMSIPQPQGFRPEDLPTPTQLNPYGRPQSQGQFAFTSLTQPMPMAAGQFAFQR